MESLCTGRDPGDGHHDLEYFSDVKGRYLQPFRGHGTRCPWVWQEWQQGSLVPSAITSIEMARTEDLRESLSVQEQRATSKESQDMEDSEMHCLGKSCIEMKEV